MYFLVTTTSEAKHSCMNRRGWRRDPLAWINELRSIRKILMGLRTVRTFYTTENVQDFYMLKIIRQQQNNQILPIRLLAKCYDNNSNFFLSTWCVHISSTVLLTHQRKKRMWRVILEKKKNWEFNIEFLCFIKHERGLLHPWQVSLIWYPYKCYIPYDLNNPIIAL